MIMKKIVGAVAVIGAAAALIAPGTAAADTTIRLKDGTTVNKLGTVGSITVSVKNQVARLSPSMVALPTSRNAWVSGDITVHIAGADPSNGNLEAGYLVGCQISLSDASFTGDGGVESGVTFGGGQAVTIDPSATVATGGSLSLKAGGVGAQPLTWDKATFPKAGDEIAPDWAEPSTNYDFEGGDATLSFSDRSIGVHACAGYAQARLYVMVKGQVAGSKGHVTLWGQPFTLG